MLIIGGLLIATFWIVRPFLGPLIWATMLVVASWPLMRRAAAAAVGPALAGGAGDDAGLLLLFVVPLALAIVTIVDNVDRLAGWAQIASDFHVPEAPPAWLVQAAAGGRGHRGDLGAGHARSACATCCPG